MAAKPQQLVASAVVAILLLAGGPAAARDGVFKKIVNAITDTPVTVAVTPQTQIEVGFSPGAGAEPLVIKTIRAAQESILVLAYSFTSKPVAAALADAARRNVKVYAVLDRSQRSEKYSSATFLANSGIAVRIDEAHAIAHNKVLVVDGRHVQTGSYNYSAAAATKNAENVLTIWNNEDLARAYAVDFRRHWDHATDYLPRY